MTPRSECRAVGRVGRSVADRIGEAGSESSVVISASGGRRTQPSSAPALAQSRSRSSSTGRPRPIRVRTARDACGPTTRPTATAGAYRSTGMSTVDRFARARMAGRCASRSGPARSPAMHGPSRLAFWIRDEPEETRRSLLPLWTPRVNRDALRQVSATTVCGRYL